ncbi:MAG: family peptidase [Gemmatimonadetes bacterium]|nr:family peptidase [Gemmatimonadota bacterium]
MRGSGGRLMMAIIVAIGGLLTYFSQRSTNTVTGEVQHVAMSVDQEQALGLQAYPEMAAQYGGEIDHPQISAYVTSVGNRVVAQSDAAKGPYQYHFHVLADPQTINAFALPGGEVSITLGLLRNLKDESELAGVLGHEVGHVIARHGAEQLSKQQLTQSLSGAAAIATYDPNNPGSARNAAIAAAIGQLVSMRFGRQDELEADALGVRLMSEASYDPNGMADLMKILASQSGGSRQPEFFSTHPNPDNRLAQITAEIQQTGAKGSDRGADRFQAGVLRYLRQ